MKRPEVPRPATHVFVRRDASMTLRIEAGLGFRNGSRLPTFAVVEWAGQVGHPSSYALIGGAQSDVAQISLVSSAALFTGSLAGTSDEVRWGLPVEYEDAVLSLLAEQPRPVLVSSAAHGAAGSSPKAFRAAALLLSHVLATGVPGSDEKVWKLWDRCWNAAA